MFSVQIDLHRRADIHQNLIAAVGSGEEGTGALGALVPYDTSLASTLAHLLFPKG